MTHASSGQSVPMMSGGIIVPWDESQKIENTTWSVRVGDVPPSEILAFEICYDYGIKEHVTWAEEHWFPVNGKAQRITGASIVASSTNGGPCHFRGVLEPGVAFRVRIVESSGMDIPVHVQCGKASYVGVISTLMPVTYLIDEEMGLEDLFNP